MCLHNGHLLLRSFNICVTGFFLQVDQLSCNGDRKLQPDRSQAIRERLRGKGLPTGKSFAAVRVMAINTALWKTKLGSIFAAKEIEYRRTC